MTWVKVGQEWFDESAGLSSDAKVAHFEALGFSNRRLLDLLIPKRLLLKFTDLLDSEHQAAAFELVAAGWWEDRGDHWYVGLKFPTWQMEKVQVENRRADLADAQRRRRRHLLGEHDLCLPTAKCKVSTVDSSADSTRDSYRDPVTVTATAAVTEAPSSKVTEIRSGHDSYSGGPVNWVTGEPA